MHSCRLRRIRVCSDVCSTVRTGWSLGCFTVSPIEIARPEAPHGGTPRILGAAPLYRVALRSITSVPGGGSNWKWDGARP